MEYGIAHEMKDGMIKKLKFNYKFTPIVAYSMKSNYSSNNYK